MYTYHHFVCRGPINEDCAIAGLFCVLLFLWYGFGAWTVGLGTFVGIPLLVLAVLLYITAVITDLKTRGAL
jgi:hypothetical protein